MLNFRWGVVAPPWYYIQIQHLLMLNLDTFLIKRSSKAIQIQHLLMLNDTVTGGTNYVF